VTDADGKNFNQDLEWDIANVSTGLCGPRKAWREEKRSPLFQLDASYLSSFGQLELHLLEGKWRACRFKYGDFVVFGQLRSHFDLIEDSGGYFLKMS